MKSRIWQCSRRRFVKGTAALVVSSLIPAERSLAQIPPAAPPVEITPPRISDISAYDVYIPTACKDGPFHAYTCEFDASWAVLKTFGVDATLEEQLAAIEIDRRVEPYYRETADGFRIFGGDITRAYSGDYVGNFLARTTGPGMQPLFANFGLRATRVRTRQRIEEQLRAGRLVWIKSTVDFKDWVPATWITPDGVEVPGVLGNDHAVVVIGYNEEVVVIRDLLGPTSTNYQRLYEVEVSWERFLTCWSAQDDDGLAVGPRTAR